MASDSIIVSRLQRMIELQRKKGQALPAHRGVANYIEEIASSSTAPRWPPRKDITIEEIILDKPLEVVVGELLRKHGWRLAVAESCTGGLVGHRITNVPGSSTYYMGSVTAYAYEAKVRLLGVRWDTLEKYGAVSKETVIEMAEGVRRALAADIAISVSGIAGPGGGTPEKPVGLIWIGLAAPDYHAAWSFLWSGDRIKNKELSAEAALQLLVDYLRGKLDTHGDDEED